jgi:hypothetical protein
MISSISQLGNYKTNYRFCLMAAIVASRDYHNHLVLAAVLGQLPMLLTALANEEPRGQAAPTRYDGPG